MPGGVEVENEDEDDDDDEEMEEDLEHVLFLLDTLIGMGSPVGPIAQKIKGLVMDLLEDDEEEDPGDAVAGPAVTKSLGKIEVRELIANEVRRQVESALKTIPPMRKGIIPQGTEKEDVQKAFDSLNPEQKLKVALALEQQQ